MGIEELDNEDSEDKELTDSSYVSSDSDEVAAHDCCTQRQAKRAEAEHAEMKGKEQDLDRSKEIEVQEARTCLKAQLAAGQSVPIGPIVEGRFSLYSVEYPGHYYVDAVHCSRHFEVRNTVFDHDFPELQCGPDQVRDNINIYSEGYLDMIPFVPPSEASLDP